MGTAADSKELDPHDLHDVLHRSIPFSHVPPNRGQQEAARGHGAEYIPYLVINSHQLANIARSFILPFPFAFVHCGLSFTFPHLQVRRWASTSPPPFRTIAHQRLASALPYCWQQHTRSSKSTAGAMWTPSGPRELSESRHWLHDTSSLQDSRSPDMIDHYLSLDSGTPELPTNPPKCTPITTDSLEKSLALAQALLKEHAHILEPLKTVLPRGESIKTSATDLSNATTRVDNSPQSLAASPIFPLRSVTSFGSHRVTHAVAEAIVPIPPAAKAMVARPPPGFNSPSHLSGSLVHRLGVAFEKVNASPPSLEAPSQMSLLSAGVTHPAKTPSTARFAALQSPCFFHERFDEAVNLDRVLEEISSEETGITHSRLMQTATSVREISKQLQRRPIKRAVRTVMIITKARDNSLVHLTRDLAEWLLLTPRYHSDVGVTVYVDAKLQTSKRFNAPSLLAKHPQMEYMLKYWTPDLCYTSPETFDLVLTLGGDGTVLFTSWLFKRIVPQSYPSP